MKWYVLFNLFLMVVSAPWIFVGWDVRVEIFGFPFWAVYAVAFTIAYAVFVAISIERLWRRDSDADRESGDG